MIKVFEITEMSEKVYEAFERLIPQLSSSAKIPTWEELDELIGSKAVMRCMNSQKISRQEATNVVCEKFLSRYGEDNFVNSIRSKFNSIQYFTCSSLGYSQNEAQFTPDGVEEPVLWIYKKIFG